MRAVEPHFVLWEVTDLKMTFQSIHAIGYRGERE